MPWIRQGFLLGGMSFKGSDQDPTDLEEKVFMSGLVNFEAEKRIWSNESTPSSVSPRRWSRPFALPYGKKGILVTLGGYAPLSVSSISRRDSEV